LIDTLQTTLQKRSSKDGDTHHLDDKIWPSVCKQFLSAPHQHLLPILLFTQTNGEGTVKQVCRGIFHLYSLSTEKGHSFPLLKLRFSLNTCCRKKY